MKKCSSLTPIRVVTNATPATDDRRKRFEQDARVLFIRWMREQRLDVAAAARLCGFSPDAVESWISGKRRVPGAALVAVGATVSIERKVA